MIIKYKILCNIRRFSVQGAALQSAESQATPRGARASLHRGGGGGVSREAEGGKGMRGSGVGTDVGRGLAGGRWTLTPTPRSFRDSSSRNLHSPPAPLRRRPEQQREKDPPPHPGHGVALEGGLSCSKSGAVPWGQLYQEA